MPPVTGACLPISAGEPPFPGRMETRSTPGFACPPVHGPTRRRGSDFSPPGLHLVPCRTGTPQQCPRALAFRVTGDPRQSSTACYETEGKSLFPFERMNVMRLVEDKGGVPCRPPGEGQRTEAPSHHFRPSRSHCG